MRIDEVTEQPVDENIDELSVRQYKQIISDLKRKDSGDLISQGAMKKVMSMWDKNEKVISKYRSIIKDFDLDI
jgi:ABC-type lipopolysaccharide export system ATPase subunit